MTKEKVENMNPGLTITADQALQAQFAKVGQLTFQIDLMIRQMIVLENENKELKEQLKPKEGLKEQLKPEDENETRDLP